MASEIKFSAGTKVYYCFNSKGDNFKVNHLKMLPKTNYASETTCLAVFLMGIRWPLKQRVQILGLLWILLGIVDFVLLMKAQITQKRFNLPKLFFVNYVRADTSNSLQYLIWFN